MDELKYLWATLAEQVPMVPGQISRQKRWHLLLHVAALCFTLYLNASDAYPHELRYKLVCVCVCNVG